MSMLTLPSSKKMGYFLTQLKEGKATIDSIIQNLAKQQSEVNGDQFHITLQQLDQRGWLNYGVLPLAVI